MTTPDEGPKPDEEPNEDLPLLTRAEGFLAPRWSRLTELGNSRLLRSSYVWFFAVPPLASLISKLGPDVHLRVLGSEWVLHLDLPFSWKIFYFASAAFAIATSIFFLRCPEIVKRYRSYAQFEAEGKGPRQVRDYFLDYLARRRLDQVSGALVSSYLTEFTTEYSGVAAQVDLGRQVVEEKWGLLDLVVESNLGSPRVPDAFWFVHRVSDSANPVSAMASGLFYLFGFVLIAIVLVQNFLYVWQLTFSP